MFGNGIRSFLQSGKTINAVCKLAVWNYCDLLLTFSSDLLYFKCNIFLLFFSQILFRYFSCNGFFQGNSGCFGIISYTHRITERIDIMLRIDLLRVINKRKCPVDRAQFISINGLNFLEIILMILVKHQTVAALHCSHTIFIRYKYGRCAIIIRHRLVILAVIQLELNILETDFHMAGFLLQNFDCYKGSCTASGIAEIFGYFLLSFLTAYLCDIAEFLRTCSDYRRIICDGYRRRILDEECSYMSRYIVCSDCFRFVERNRIVQDIQVFGESVCSLDIFTAIQRCACRIQRNLIMSQSVIAANLIFIQHDLVSRLVGIFHVNLLRRCAAITCGIADCGLEAVLSSSLGEYLNGILILDDQIIHKLIVRIILCFILRNIDCKCGACICGTEGSLFVSSLRLTILATAENITIFPIVLFSFIYFKDIRIKCIFDRNSILAHATDENLVFVAGISHTVDILHTLCGTFLCHCGFDRHDLIGVLSLNTVNLNCSIIPMLFINFAVCSIIKPVLINGRSKRDGDISILV